MKVISRFVCICLLLLGASRARAATVEVCLRVDQFQIAGPTPPATVGPFGNPAPIPMWGFIQTGIGAGCTFTVPATSPTVSTHPFPSLLATEGDTLIIHLSNNLPIASQAVYTEPVSVVIPGQPGDFTPTWDSGSPGDRTNVTQRVRSFTKETPQQNVAPVDYKFGPLKAGTYLIESGTHPAVQAQMGLYGVLSVRPTIAGRAYANPTSAFDSELTLLLSEIDPVVHAAIASGQYGSAPSPAPAGWLTSTIEYHPKYFLINGRPFTNGAAGLRIGGFNRKVLIRFLNASLDTKVPALMGSYLSVIAEDGNFLSASGFTGTPPNQMPASCPAPKAQYSVLLPAGKTMDTILVTPRVPGAIPLYDRRLHLTNNGASPGGMIATLVVTAAGGAANPPPPPAPCTLVGAPIAVRR